MKDEFLSAITQGNVAKVQEMLAAEPALAKVSDDNGVSAILKATYYRQQDVVVLLLNAGIELNIFEAAATGETQRVRALVKQDPKLVNAFSPDGFTPLSLAVFFGHQQSVEALLAAGAKVNIASREAMKVTPLHSAAAGRQLAIARLLIASGADVNAKQDGSGFTPLHEAAANGDLDFAALLLDQGAEVNVRMNDGKTPLGFALERSQDEMATFLRQRGAE